MTDIFYLRAHEHEILRLINEVGQIDKKGLFEKIKSEMLTGSLGECVEGDQSLSGGEYTSEVNEIDKERAAKRLGLRLEGENISSRHYVGQVWGPKIQETQKRVSIIVLPKKPQNADNSIVDPFQMAQECFRYGEIAGRMRGCFYFWPDEEPLQSHFDRDCVRFFVIAFYLNALAELCKRHLRNEFIRIQENLCSKAKGKILVHQNLRLNSVRGRIDRMCCQYQKHSMNSPENQILRAALEQCLKEIRRNNNMFQRTKVHEWSLHCDRALSGVTLRRINMAEFQSIHLGGLKKAYKKPLELAKWVLKLLGNDPNKVPDASCRRETIFPFAIAMDMLFERYCEALLSMEDGCKVLFAGNENFGTGMSKVRPDFIVENNDEYKVLDAKYKYNWINDSSYRCDVFQVVAYTRHNIVKKRCSNSYPTRAVIMVPDLDVKGIQRDKNFLTDYSDPELQLYKVGLPVRPAMHS